MLEESARIALSWIRAHSAELGIPSAAPGAASNSGAAHGAHTCRAATDPSCWDVHSASPATHQLAYDVIMHGTGRSDDRLTKPCTCNSAACCAPLQSFQLLVLPGTTSNEAFRPCIGRIDITCYMLVRSNPTPWRSGTGFIALVMTCLVSFKHVVIPKCC